MEIIWLGLFCEDNRVIQEILLRFVVLQTWTCMDGINSSSENHILYCSHLGQIILSEVYFLRSLYFCNFTASKFVSSVFLSYSCCKGYNCPFWKKHPEVFLNYFLWHAFVKIPQTQYNSSFFNHEFTPHFRATSFGGWSESLDSASLHSSTGSPSFEM